MCWIELCKHDFFAIFKEFQSNDIHQQERAVDKVVGDLSGDLSSYFNLNDHDELNQRPALQVKIFLSKLHFITVTLSMILRLCQVTMMCSS